MLDRGERLQGLADYFIVNAAGLGCEGCRHRVVDVVLSAEREVFQEDVAFVVVVFDYDFVVVQPCAFFHFVLLCERQLLGFDDYLVEMVYGYLVV